MCGIVGLAGEWSPELLAKLNNSQQYRGPDEGGEYCGPVPPLRLPCAD